jgi:aminopeptidase N
MFPCFDEPQFRARFTLHVAAPREWTVISNMPLRGQRDDGTELVWSDFEATPPMPAYALTLDGGSFVHVDGAAGGVPIRVFVRSGQEEQARQVLANAEQLLPFYERFFGVPFPLPKLDIVIKNGVLQSAFEGWGAITFYTENEIFGHQFNGGEHGRRYAVEILAHEMAHEWTGDLVTMRWWSDAFVSEGVAQYAQRVATRALFPELQTWIDDDDGVVSLFQNGVEPATKPVLAPIESDLQAEDRNAFGSATYDKGASVLEAWDPGGSAIRAGLRRYLRRFAFGSATFDDFWNALGGAAAVRYGRSWLGRPGFPIVDVRATCAAGTTIATLTQQPFVSDKAIGTAYRAQRWIVPLTVRVGSHARRVMLTSRREAVAVKGCGDVTVDPGERPYYVARYDGATYGRLARTVGSADRRSRDRLYSDATILHGTGQLPDLSYVRLLAAAQAPLDPSVWLLLAQEYSPMDLLLRDTTEANVLAAMQRRTLRPFVLEYDRLDSTDAGPFRLGFDSGWALATSGDAVDGAALHPDYVRLLDGDKARQYDAPWLVARIAAAAATSDDVQRTEALVRAPTPDNMMLPFGEVFLQNVGDEALARRVLDDAMADSRLTAGDPTSFLFALGTRHPRLVFAYLRDHFRAVEGRLPPTQQAWTICDGVANTLWSAGPPRELARFLRGRFPAGDGRVAAERAIGRVEQSWRERNVLRQALRTFEASSGARGSSAAIRGPMRERSGEAA